MSEKKKIKIDRSKLGDHSVTGGSLGAPPKKSAPIGLFLFLIMMVVLGLGAYYLYAQKQKQDAAEQARKEAAQRVFTEAQAFAKANPEDVDAIVARFEQVKAELKLPVFTELADLEIQRAKAGRKNAANKVLKELLRKSGGLARGKKFQEAIAVLSDYQGPWAEETKLKREEQADKIRELAEKNQVQVAKQEQEAEVREQEAEKVRASYPKEVDAIAEAYRIAAAKVEADIATRQASLRKSYLNMLKQLEQSYRSKGELDPLLDIKKEIERFEQEQAIIMDVPDDVDPGVQKVMARFAVETLSIDDDLTKKLGYVQSAIAIKLDGLVKQLTLKDQIDDALAVRELIEYVKAGQDLGEVIRNAGVKLTGGRGDWISEDATYAATSRMTTRSYYKRNVLFKGQRMPGLGDYAFHSSGPGPHWLIIDLRKKALVGGLVIQNLGGKGMASAKTLTVWVSHNKKNWKEVWRAKQPEQTFDIVLRPTSCRYVKIGLREDAAFHLQGVKIFGRK